MITRLFTVLITISSFTSLLAQDHKEGYLLFKIEPEQQVYCQDGMKVPAIVKLLQPYADTIYKRFPLASPPAAKKRQGYRTVDLTLIYEVKLNQVGVEHKLIKQLNQLQEVTYSCLDTYSEITLTPNDPLFSDQYHHQLINTPAAWDIQTGNNTVRIAILDTGSDMDHPDLAPTTYISSADPINGVDDDNNGYIDDNQGWDFVDNDRVPQATVNDHGVHVAGLATAATNNGIGIAGTGFQCQQVPIRVGEDRSITDGYNGVVYAADQGFEIINCSWGSFSYSPFAQDVVTYASVNKGALVVAAAGNNGKDQPFYPAAYDHVLAVGASQQTNERASFSNFGFWVDLLAPGQTINSTLDEGAYGLNTGTSMSTPIVAGVAGLVKAQYPQLTGLQIAERIKSTTTDISQVGNNGAYEDKIGTGLLNAEAAVSGIIVDPSVVYEYIQLTDMNNDAFAMGDTVRMGGIFTNYLDTSDSLTAELIASSSAVTLRNSVYQIGVLPSLGTSINYNSPFEFIITNQASINEDVVFDLKISGGGYEVIQKIVITVNVDYVNVLVNDIETSIAGNSSIGFLEREGSDGLGFGFSGESSQLFEAGFMLGLKQNGQTKVLDNIRDGQQLNLDFVARESIFEEFLDDTAFAAYATFSDFKSTGDSAGVTVKLVALAFEDPGHRDYVLLNYNILNESNSNFDSVYASIFTDWDIAPYDQNRALWNGDYQVGYSFVPGDISKGYFGVQLIEGISPHPYHFDNVNGASGINIFNDFPTAKKFDAMRSTRTDAGFVNTTGNDVLQMLSSGPYSLSAGDSIQVTFAVIGARSLDLLLEAADSAYAKVNGGPLVSVNEIQSQQGVKLFPNPASESMIVYMEEEIEQIEIYNQTGQLVFQQKKNNQCNLTALPKGLYIVRVKHQKGTSQTKLIRN